MAARAKPAATFDRAGWEAKWRAYADGAHALPSPHPSFVGKDGIRCTLCGGAAWNDDGEWRLCETCNPPVRAPRPVDQ